MKAPGDPAPYVLGINAKNTARSPGRLRTTKGAAGLSRRRAITPSLGVKWCAARGLAPQAQAKIEKELQSRLDESLARAIQEQEGGGAAAAVPDDVC